MALSVACRTLRLNCDDQNFQGFSCFTLSLLKNPTQASLDWMCTVYGNKEEKNEDLHQEPGSEPPIEGGKDNAALNKLNPRFYNSPASQKRRSPTAETKQQSQLSEEPQRDRRCR